MISIANSLTLAIIAALTSTRLAIDCDVIENGISIATCNLFIINDLRIKSKDIKKNTQRMSLSCFSLN